MKIGAYTPEIRLQPLERVFEEAHKLGFDGMQYSFFTSHREEIPPVITKEEVERIARACRDYNMEIIAVNGTFNMIDPDLPRRRENIRRFEGVACAAKALGCDLLTLCTGSRSEVSGWTHHPDNALDDAWAELMQTTRILLEIAERYGLCLGVETEASNVVSTVERTRRYLDEAASSHLKVIMDCANLFPTGTAQLENVRPTIRKAFDLLGRDIVLAHGKDILPGREIRFTNPGRGIVDYGYFFSLLREIGYKRGLILHGIKDPVDFPYSIRYIQQKLDSAGL